MKQIINLWNTFGSKIVPQYNTLYLIYSHEAKQMDIIDVLLWYIISSGRIIKHPDYTKLKVSKAILLQVELC